VLFDEFVDYIKLSVLQSFKSFRIVEGEHFIWRGDRRVDAVFTGESM